MINLTESLGNLKFLGKSKEAKSFIINAGYNTAGKDSATVKLKIKGSNTSTLNKTVNATVRAAGEEYKDARIYLAITVSVGGKEEPVFVGSKWLTERNWGSIAIEPRWRWSGDSEVLIWKRHEVSRTISDIGALLDTWGADGYNAYVIFPDKKKAQIRKERALAAGVADKNFDISGWDKDHIQPLFSGASIIKVMKRGNSADSTNKKIARNLIAKLTDHVETAESYFDYEKDLKTFDQAMRKVVDANTANKELANIDPKKKYSMSDVKTILKDKKK